MKTTATSRPTLSSLLKRYRWLYLLGWLFLALLAWPNPQVRTLALVTATFEESATGRQLAADYIPGTPDPTKGSIKVVALDDLALIGWTLDDVTSFHLTFGSVSPGSC